MKLKTKMIAISLIPAIVLGVILFLVAAKQIESSVYEEAYVGMEAAALAEENSASMQEIMASIESIYQRLGSISEKTKDLSGMSQKMKECVDVFRI